MKYQNKIINNRRKDPKNHTITKTEKREDRRTQIDNGGGASGKYGKKKKINED